MISIVRFEPRVPNPRNRREDYEEIVEATVETDQECDEVYSTLPYDPTRRIEYR